MSLIVDPSKCEKGPPATAEEEVELEAIATMMALVGVDAITRKSASDLYARIRFYELLHAYTRTTSPETIERWVGLRTNLSYTEERKDFMVRLGSSSLHDLVNEYLDKYGVVV